MFLAKEFWKFNVCFDINILLVYLAIKITLVMMVVLEGKGAVTEFEA